MSYDTSSRSGDVKRPPVSLIRGASPSIQALGLDDRIRDLCTRVVNSAEDQLEPFMRELRAALREHNDRLRKFAASELTRSRPQQNATS